MATPVNRPRSLSVERKRNESKANEHKLAISVEKHALDFGLKGDACPVVEKDETNKIVKDSVTYTNTDTKKKYFFYVVVDSSPKWEISVSPMKGELGPKKQITFSVSLRVFLTTRVKSFIDIFFSENKSSAKEAAQAREKGQDFKKKADVFPLTIIVNLETALSPNLDLDEVIQGKCIGRGGNGEVWKVEWRGSEYALKKFLMEDMIPEEKQMILREIDLMRSFPPNKYLISYAASTRIPEQPPAILMEYCPKGSLSDLIKTKTLENRFRLKIAIDIARGMIFLHANKIFHRDLKPGNLLVVSDLDDLPLDHPNIKITDFGTSRAYVATNNYLKSKSNLKSERILIDKIDDSSLSKGVGTLQYTAPEMLEGKDNYELDKLDIYSYGVVLWELFAQVVPYTQPSTEPYTKSKWDLIDFVKSGRRLKIPSCADQCITSLIEKCWAQEPLKRPSFKEIEKLLLIEYEGVCYEPKLDQETISYTGYRGTIDRKIAESALASAPVGTFLTRWSIAQQSYVISYTKGDGIAHISGIKITNNKISVGAKEFDNLINCVKLFQEQKKITNPLPFSSSDQSYETPNV